jgi:hypothetical protein
MSAAHIKRLLDRERLSASITIRNRRWDHGQFQIAESGAAVGHLGCAHASAPIIVFCALDRLQATLRGTGRAVKSCRLGPDLIPILGPNAADRVSGLRVPGSAQPVPPIIGKRCAPEQAPGSYRNQVF